MSNQKSIKTAMAHIERAIAEPNNTMSDGKALKEIMRQLNFAKAALVEALEQQEPVAWFELLREARDNCKASIVEEGISASRKEYRIDLEARLTAALNTSPPASKPWVGLTDEEVVDLKMLGRDLEFVSMKALRRFARDIEATLKEKNA